MSRFTLVCASGIAIGALSAGALVPAALGQQKRPPNSPAAPQQPGQPRSAAPQQANPSQPAATPELARGKALIAETAYAKTQTAKTVDDYTEVINTCLKGLSLGVDEATGKYAERLMAWAHNRRGEAYSETAAAQQQTDQRAAWEHKALAEFETAIQLDPACWRAYHNRGVSLAQMSDFEQAMRDFERTIELQPMYANAWFNRGELRSATGDLRGAVEDYNQTLRLNPRDAASYNSRGHARYRLRQVDEALADLNQALQLDPNLAAAYANRGDLVTARGQYDRAALDYRKAIELDKQLGRAYQGAAWLMATCPEQHYRDPQKAIAAATKAIELDGRLDWRALDVLAAAQASAGRYEEAVENAQKALQVAPDEFRPVVQQRLALYQQNKPFREPPQVAQRNKQPSR